MMPLIYINWYRLVGLLNSLPMPKVSLLAEMFLNFVFPFAECDATYPWQIFFQDPATPMMEGIIKFHDVLMFLIIFITLFVLTFLYDIQKLFNRVRFKEDPKVLMSHHTVLEIVWTLIPTVLLACVAFPSFYLLYSFEEFIDPTITVKITGYQWYWNYSISDFENTWFPTIGNLVILTGKGSNFDSYMIEHISNLWVDNPWPAKIAQNPSLKNLPGRFVYSFFRLLQTDRILYLPVNTHIRLLVTSADVLHSWAVPSFGIKIDACPGRLSQVSLFIKRTGMFFGQCSEICGVNHGFMPICVQVVPTVQYAGGLYNFWNGVIYPEYAAPIKDLVAANGKIGSVCNLLIRTKAMGSGNANRNLGLQVLGITFPDYGYKFFNAAKTPAISNFNFVDNIPMQKNSSFFSKIR